MDIKERIWKGITTKQKLVGSVALLVFLVFVVNPFYTVDEGERVVVKTFGEVSSIAEPGLNFAWPIVNSLTYYDIRTQTYDADCASASKDLQTVHTKVSVLLRPDAGKIGEIYANVGSRDQYLALVDKTLQDVVKASTAKFTAEELVTKREHVAYDILQNLSNQMERYNLIIQSTPIQNFQFSPEFDAAIEAKNIAMQDKLRAQQRYEQTVIDQKAELAKREVEAKALELKKAAATPQLVELARIDSFNNWVAKWDGKSTPQVVLPDTGMIPMMDLGSITGAKT